MRNYSLKLLSILIAVLLSLYIKSESNITTAQILVPVDIRDLPSDKIVVWQLKRQVIVEVKGPSFLITRLIATPPTLKIKLPDQSVSKYTAPINRADLAINDPVQVVSIEPPSISFAIENKIQKEVPVKIAMIGQLNKEMRIAKTSVTPETVTIIGPESEIATIKSVQTAAIDLKELKDNFREETTLRIPGKLSQSSATSAKVVIDVLTLDRKRTFKDIPLEVRQSGNTLFNLSTRVVDVSVLGVPNEIDLLSDSKIVPFVKIPRDYNGKTSIELPVSVEIPEGFIATSVFPDKVTIKNSISSTKVINK